MKTPRKRQTQTSPPPASLARAFDVLATHYGWPAVLQALREAGLTHCSRTVVTAATEALDTFAAHDMR